MARAPQSSFWSLSHSWIKQAHLGSSWAAPICQPLSLLPWELQPIRTHPRGWLGLWSCSLGLLPFLQGLELLFFLPWPGMGCAPQEALGKSEIPGSVRLPLGMLILIVSSVGNLKSPWQPTPEHERGHLD